MNNLNGILFIFKINKIMFYISRRGGGAGHIHCYVRNVFRKMKNLRQYC